MPSPQRSGRLSSLLFVCFFGECEKFWSLAAADIAFVQGRGAGGGHHAEGESYRELANKLAGDRAGG